MKKTLIVAAVLFLVVTLAGCGTVPARSTGTGFTLSQSLWRSDDGGVTWAVKNKGQGQASTTSIDVLSFTVDPTNGNHVWAGLRSGGILETTDGGDTWKFMANWTAQKVYGLVVDPTGRTLYASGVWQGTGKIFKTTDDGATWKEIYTSSSSGPLVISLTIDNRNPNVLYATTSDNQVIKSSDGGISWQNIYQANAPVLKLGIDAGNSKLLYFITQAGSLFESKNGGATFQDISSNISQSVKGFFGGSDFSVLAVDPTVSGRLYLAGSGGIVMSQDEGATWKVIPALGNPQTFPITALAIDPLQSNNLIYGADQATYRSTDGGTTWTTAQFDVSYKVNALAYNPQNSDVIYAGFTK